MQARAFDLAFDEGEDLDALVDGTKPRWLNVDFPGWIVERLDCDARRLGLMGEALIDTWIAEGLG